MTTTDFAWFKRVLPDKAALELTQYGYHQLVTGENEEIEPEYAAVEFQKKLLPDVYCTIGFQLLKHYIHPNRNFQIILDRRRHPISPPENGQESTNYAYLKMGLRNVLAMYSINPFPKGVFFWSFADEESLTNSLSEAVPLVVKYGIPWLEDPSSNMD